MLKLKGFSRFRCSRRAANAVLTSSSSTSSVIFVPFSEFVMRKGGSALEELAAKY